MLKKRLLVSTFILSVAANAAVAQGTDAGVAPTHQPKKSRHVRLAQNTPPPVATPGTVSDTTAGQAGAGAPNGRNKVEEVVVTGTSIRGIRSTGSEVSTLNRAAIEATGATTTTEVLRAIPQVSSSFNSTGTSTGTSQANFLDQPAIHGVGVGNGGGGLTLLLFDGFRLPGAGINQTTPDASVIPVSALQRVEVVADGASSIYGSDAIAGVINFIPRRDYDGAITHLQGGVGSDYDTENFSQVFGKTWSTGGLIADYEYSRNSELQANQRSYTSDNALGRGFGDQRIQACQPANFTVGGVSYGLNSSGAPVAGLVNKCESHALDDLYPAQQHNQFYLSGHQQLNDNVEVFAQELFSRRDIDTRLGDGSTQLNPQSSNFSVTVPSTSPFYIPVAGANGAPESVLYDGGPGSYVNHISTSTEVFRTGLNFHLGDWKGTAVYNYGFERDDVSQFGSNQNYATAAAASGLLNPFIPGSQLPGAVSSALTNYRTQYIAEQRIHDVVAKADGPLFALPGGTVRAAVGVEYRNESFDGFTSQGPDGFPAAQQAANGYSSFAANGGRDSKSVFGEVLVPLVGPENNIPLIRSLNLSAAVRYDDYSDVGSTANPKFALIWKPIDDLQLRATYGESFHAPSLADSQTAIDTRVIVFPDMVTNNPNRYSLILAGGNKLQPETAKTYSAGFDWKPSQVPGLTISPTWFDIQYNNVITFPTFNPVSEPTNPVYDPYRIYSPTLAQAQAAVAGFARSQGTYNLLSSLPTAIYDLRRQNFANETINGMDFTADYKLPETRYGKFDTSLSGTWLFQFDQNIKRSSQPLRLLDTDYAINFRARASLGWSLDPFQAIAFLNYTQGYKNFAVGSYLPEHVSPFVTVDLHLAYTFPNVGYTKDLQATVEVDNLFNTNPPYFYNTNGISGVDQLAANPLGTVVQFGITKKF